MILLALIHHTDVLKSTIQMNGFHSLLLLLTCMQPTWHAGGWDMVLLQDMPGLDFYGKIMHNYVLYY